MKFFFKLILIFSSSFIVLSQNLSFINLFMPFFKDSLCKNNSNCLFTAKIEGIFPILYEEKNSILNIFSSKIILVSTEHISIFNSPNNQEIVKKMII